MSTDFTSLLCSRSLYMDSILFAISYLDREVLLSLHLNFNLGIIFPHFYASPPRRTLTMLAIK